MGRTKNKPLADGRYRVRVYIGIENNQKKYKSVYGKTQREADRKADELRMALRKGVNIASTNDSFSIWADYWLISKKQEVSVDRYNSLVTRTSVWKDALQSTPMAQIKPFDLQSILFSISAKNPLTNKPMAKKTARGYVQIINSIFDFAIDNRIIEYNPATKLKVNQSAPEEKRRALTPIERQRVIEFEHRAKPSAMLMMFSGLRRGEATALQWNDIDFENNTINVTKSYNFKQKEFKLPKNNKARVVSVPQMLVDYLQTLPRVSPFVLTSASGNMMTDDAWKRLYQSYMTDMNLKYGKFMYPKNKYAPTKTPMVITPFTPHELRHTFCTIMFEAGVDALTAKEQLGHADIKTTLEIYTHLSQEHKEKDIKKLDEYLKYSV